MGARFSLRAQNKCRRFYIPSRSSHRQRIGLRYEEPFAVRAPRKHGNEMRALRIARLQSCPFRRPSSVRVSERKRAHERRRKRFFARRNDLSRAYRFNRFRFFGCAQMDCRRTAVTPCAPKAFIANCAYASINNLYTSSVVAAFKRLSRSSFFLSFAEKYESVCK